MTAMDQIPQLLANGLMFGAFLALPAIGLTLIYAVLRFPSFAVASHATVGAFAGMYVNLIFGVPIPIAILASFVISGAIGVLSDELAVKPIAGRGFLAVAIATIALTMILENIIRVLFGNQMRAFNVPLYRDWSVGGVHIAPQQAYNLFIAVAVMAGAILLLKVTDIGKTIRAVADNPTLADLRGIDPFVVRRVVNFVAFGIVGVGGALLGSTTSVDPLLGFRIILPVFAAAVVGGMGSVPGAVVGSLVVGVGQELSLLVVEPVYRSAFGFIAILAVLSVRPNGIFGAAAR